MDRGALGEIARVKCDLSDPVNAALLRLEAKKPGAGIEGEREREEEKEREKGRRGKEKSTEK